MNKVKAWCVKDTIDNEYFVHTIDESEFMVNKSCEVLNQRRSADVFVVVPVMIEITEITNEQSKN